MSGKLKIVGIVFAIYLILFGPVLAVVAKFKLEETAIKYPLAVYMPLAYVCLKSDLLFGYANFWIGLGDLDVAEELKIEYLEGGLEIGW